MKKIEIILSVLTIVTFILVGTPIKYNCFELNLIINIIGIIYYIYQAIKKKNKIRRIDIIVILLCLSSLIPYIFKTYINLEDTLINIAMSMSLFNIYMFAQSLDEKGKKHIINIILLGTMIILILGILERTDVNFGQYIQKIGLPTITNYENRMFSTLGYTNSFAILMAIGMMLSVDKTKKPLYSGLFFLFSIGLLLSYSRFTTVFFVILFVIYFSLLNEKEHYIMITIENVILSFIYLKIYEKLFVNEQYIGIWLTTLIMFGISIILARVSKNVKIKIDKRKTIICSVCVVLGLIIAYLIGIHCTKPLNIFNDGQSNEEVRYNIYHIKPNTYYKFEFDIDAKSITNIAEHYSIEIVEENKYYDTVEKHKISFNNYTGQRTIEFTTSEETQSIALLINSSEKVAQRGLCIKSLEINDEEYPLNYLYLPVKFVKRIENFFGENQSGFVRLIYMKDSLKIIKDNILTGVGGKGWLYTYKDYQSYNYSTTETHNYLLKLIIENGILAGILWCILAGTVIYQTLKNKNNLSIGFTFLLLTLHSFVDFDLSFYLIIYIWFLLCGLGVNEEEKEVKNYNIVVAIILIAVLFISMQYYKIDKETQQGTLYQNYRKMSEEETKDIVDEILNKKIKADSRENVRNNEILKKIMEESKYGEIKKKISNQIITTNDQMIENIKDKYKNRLTKEEIEMYLNIQKNIYEFAVKIKDEE